MKKDLRIISIILCLLLCFSIVSLPGYAYSAQNGPSFNGLDEYEQVLKKYNTTRSYIHASRLTILGDFKYGQMIGRDFRPDYRYYLYNYSSGYSVYIDHDLYELKFATTQMMTLPSDTESMRHTKPPASTEAYSYYYYFRNGLYYIYSRSGNLYSLEWFANDIHFSIDVYDRDYLTTVPVIEQLMSVSDDEANAAFDELCNSADLKPHRQHFTEYNAMIDKRNNFILTTVCISICVVIFVSVISTHIIRKKHRARAIRYACSIYNNPESR